MFDISKLTDSSKKFDLTIRLKYVDKNTYDENRMCDQMIRDKIGKNKAWFVCSSYTDFKNKSYVFTVLKGNDASEKHIVSFDDAVKILGWKHFKYEDDNVTIFFEPIAYAMNEPFEPDENGFKWHEV